MAILQLFRTSRSRNVFYSRTNNFKILVRDVQSEEVVDDLSSSPRVSVYARRFLSRVSFA